MLQVVSNRGCLKRKWKVISWLLMLIFLALFTTAVHHKLFSSLQRPSQDVHVDQSGPINYSDQEKSAGLRIGEDSNYSPRNENACDSINLALVCGGFNSTRSLYVLIKSILFYRTDMIHLHLFVDSISHTILTELFSGWLVDDLKVSFYNITKYEREVSWITNPHYSHRFGLMKLELLSVLADRMDSPRLERVILLDTDMLVLGNIRHVWLEFERFSQSGAPIFGLVENQSDWYLGTGQPLAATNAARRSVWPAPGRGYNSGLILVDLVQLRRIDWRLIWRQEAESQLTSYLSTTLADQDIFNAVFKSRNWMVHKLPCAFNLQLNDHSRLDEICKQRRAKGGTQIVHWNSPRKLDTRNPSARMFRNWYINFRNWDAKLLEVHDCTANSRRNSRSYSNQAALSTSDFSNMSKLYCDNIRPQSSDRLRVYPYFMEFDFEPSQWDVTYVVHLSMDRMQVFDQLAHHWQGPISAAIYLSELETDLLISSIQASNNLHQRRNIGYHLVYHDYGFNYPINRLRNIALNHSVTPYVFLSDVDFLPSSNLYDYLKQSIAKFATDDSTINDAAEYALPKKALVVPAFESLQYRFDFPSNKEELKTRLNLGSVSIFREQIWPQGHSPTNYPKWRASSSAYEVDWAPEYEPFIVTSREVPRFDERFVGFGWNKVEHIMQLAALNYKFIVLPEAFVIHKIHSASFDIMKHRESLGYKVCIRHLKKTFLDELRAKYPDFMNGTATHRTRTFRPVHKETAT